MALVVERIDFPILLDGATSFGLRLLSYFLSFFCHHVKLPVIDETDKDRGPSLCWI